MTCRTAINQSIVATQKHYTSQGIQPIEYIFANNLGFLEGNIVKYVTRYKHKDGVKDLLKARQYLDWLIEKEKTGLITVPRS